jgi:hypothetical protein
MGQDKGDHADTKQNRYQLQRTRQNEAESMHPFPHLLRRRIPPVVKIPGAFAYPLQRSKITVT